MNRLCKECNILKLISDFKGNRNYCKKCIYLQRKIRESKDPKYKEANKKRNSSYYKKNKDKLDKNVSLWRKNNLDRYKQIQKNSKIKNINHIKEANKIWYNNNKEKIKIKQSENREYINSIYKIYYAKNKERITKRMYFYTKRRLDENPAIRLKSNLRSRVAHAIIKGKGEKYYRTEKLVGCTLKFLQLYIESKFLPTMTWENYGKYWHIDHIIPCRVFDLTKDYEQKACFHYTNMQPLFATTQVIDGIKYTGNLNKQ